MTTRADYDYLKRIVDLALSSAALALTSPIQLAIALVIRIKLGSPVLFRQQRPGKDGRLFTLVKFRTMREPDPSIGLVTDAERITKLGKLLRSTSLDELPTLWNVVRGDMSLVGPRPLLPKYLPLYSSRQSLRHAVRPGITGLAQICGRNGLDWSERLELDVRYVERRSLKLDVRIILATFSTVLRRQGVSQPGHVTMAEFTGTDHRDTVERQ